MAPPTNPFVSSILPPKESTLFKRIVRCYEHKQYKHGLKFAKQILSNPKYAEHGETLAMKGLILNCMGKKDEAYEYVKRGLKNDVRSHVCWHVYGLLQRSDKKYDEAIKAYRNALKIDKENLQILRDLSLLQLQMRDLTGFKETRHQLFTLRPTQKASWITFTVAHHLLEDYDTASKLIEEFRRTHEQPTKALDYEYSELLLYQNMVYREAGRFSEAYDHLIMYNSFICDKLSYLEIEADLLMKLNRQNDAAGVYRELISRNSENIAYYQNLEECLSESFHCSNPDEVLDRRLKFYDDMCKSYPRSLTPKRLPLTFTHGAKFVSLLKPYAMIMLRKGVPPLFISLRSLYEDKAKVALIEDVFLSFADCLEKSGKFPEEKVVESPTTILWVYYFLALHFDCVKNFTRALHYIDKATDHTPTLIELLTARAKICKHSGDFKEAARLMEEAQSLDTADRYVNSKCAKYMLRAGMIQEAEQMCGKFTREGGSPMENLNEMQCMWFQTQCAQSYLDLNKLGEALKKCHEVERHFVDIVEDQFDFHTYCVRRMTLCAYVRMLRLEDTLRKHRWYYKAARVAITIYIRLYDKPYDENEHDGGQNADQAKSSEAKKQRRKEKKQNLKNEQLHKNPKDQQQQQQSAPGGNVGAAPKTAPKNPDPDAEELKKEPLDAKVLVKTTAPLDDAMKFLRPLIQLDSPDIDAYLLGFEVFFRRNKLLMMLYCLKKAVRLNPNHASLADCKDKFKKYMSNNKCDSAILEIVLEEMDEVFSGPDSKNDKKPTLPNEE